MANVFDTIPTDEQTASNNVFDSVPTGDEAEEPKVKPENPRAALVNSMADKPKIGDSIVDTLHSMGSGALHSVIGGYKGLATREMGGSWDDAADAVNDELAKSYQAPESVAKTVMESKYNPLNWAQNAADYAADKSADAGWSPGVSTAIKSAPTALAALTGTAGLMRGRGVAAAAPTLTPEEAVAQATAKQSMGAAAAPVDVSKATPELRDAIANTDPNKLNTEAMQRHLRAESLPLPADMTPLRLRKGQATRDAQQISDEKNLRTDQDAGPALSASITDQSKKLGASIGEIQQRAVPDIVQRTDAEHDQAAIDAIKSQDNATVTDIRAKYKALADANGGDMPIDGGAAVDEIDPILKKRALRNTVKAHPFLSEVMDTLRGGEPIDFETFEDWRSGLAEVQRGKDGQARTAAGIIHNTLNNMPLTEETSGLRDLADTARDAAAARFETIKRNPAYKAAIEDNVPMTEDRLHDIGASSPLAGTFLDRFATGDRATAAPALVARLKQAVPNPEFHQAIEGATLNKLRDAAGINPLGEGVFKPAAYGKAVDNLGDKASLLMKPETLENVNHLKDVAHDVAFEDPASATNRSGSGLALMRYGALPSAAPSIAGDLAHFGVEHATSKIPVVGGIVRSIGSHILKGRAEQSVRNAKLKFAQDATKPGAGIDWQPPRPARASGGRVTDIDTLVNRLMSRWKQVKRETNETTKPLLGMPDSAIAKALDVAQQSI